MGTNILPQSLITQFALAGEDQRKGAEMSGAYTQDINGKLAELQAGVQKWDPTCANDAFLGRSPIFGQSTGIPAPVVDASALIASHLAAGRAPDGSSIGVVLGNGDSGQVIWTKDTKTGEYIQALFQNAGGGTSYSFQIRYSAAGVPLSTRSLVANGESVTETSALARPTGSPTITAATRLVDSFDLTTSTLSAAEREGAADPQANAAAVADGLVSSGGGWQITTDPKQLNDDSFINGIKDNTANAAFTQILSDGWRPGNGNLVGPVIDRVAAANGAYGWGSVAGQNASFGLSGTPVQGIFLNTANAQARVTLPTDPLVLDLNGDGVRLTSYVNDPVLFDTDNDGGSLERTGWVSKEDGIVVVDRNKNGRIDDISETLSEYYGDPVATNGAAGQKHTGTSIGRMHPGAWSRSGRKRGSIETFFRTRRRKKQNFLEYKG
ncbi:hypothetical protein [Cupriavidus basilensis]|uniref:hypothetical protein n=1 Tax=Cupriavidus basilensis TaxID=68895 RepID=UPI0020A69C83|nr:hypothetical protein [Cupriavidus basilensis]MCP3022365.1 hypothetical protein [Cupriavidus basilensis]